MGGYLVDCPMGKNPAFSLCWGELQKLGDLKCKGKQTSLNQPEKIWKMWEHELPLLSGGRGSVIRGEMNLSRSTGVVSLVSWGRVRGSPIL